MSKSIPYFKKTLLVIFLFISFFSVNPHSARAQDDTLLDRVGRGATRVKEFFEDGINSFCDLHNLVQERCDKVDMMIKDMFSIESDATLEGEGNPLTESATCYLNSQTLDARCKCPRYMCRLSTLDDKQYKMSQFNEAGWGFVERKEADGKTYLYLIGYGAVTSGDGIAWVEKELKVAELTENQFSESGELGNSTSLKSKGLYSCFDAGFQLPKGENGGGSGREENFRSYSILSSQPSFKEAFFSDSFNRNPSAQSVPQESVCRVVDGSGKVYTSADIAAMSKAELEQKQYDLFSYWYDPGYFDSVLPKDSPYHSKNSSSNIFGTFGKCSPPVLVSKDLFGKPAIGTDTFFGCLPNSTNGLVAFIVRLITGISGAITILIMMINLIKIISSSNNPDAITEARKRLVGAFTTFILLISSVTLLNIIGIQILDIGNFGGGILKVFTGG